MQHFASGSLSSERLTGFRARSSRATIAPGGAMKKLFLLAGLAVLGCSRISSNLDATPTNDLPNPYRAIIPWGTLPEGHAWGALNAGWVDNDGKSLWVADRCGANPDVPPGESAFLYDSCAGSDWAPVHKL